ncbi:unnamed protein product [Lota lota]
MLDNTGADTGTLEVNFKQVTLERCIAVVHRVTVLSIPTRGRHPRRDRLDPDHDDDDDATTSRYGTSAESRRVFASVYVSTRLAAH